MLELLNLLLPNRLPGEFRSSGSSARPQSGQFDALVDTASQEEGAPRVVRELPAQADSSEQINYANLLRQARLQRVGGVESRDLPPTSTPTGARLQRALAAYREQAQLADASMGGGELVGIDLYA